MKDIPKQDQDDASGGTVPGPLDYPQYPLVPYPSPFPDPCPTPIPGPYPGPGPEPFPSPYPQYNDAP